MDLLLFDDEVSDGRSGGEGSTPEPGSPALRLELYDKL